MLPAIKRSSHSVNRPKPWWCCPSTQRPCPNNYATWTHI